MKAGQRSYIPGVGAIRITRIEPVELDQLTDADALPDGFATAVELRAELKSIYSEKPTAGYQAFRVCFELTQEHTAG